MFRCYGQLELVGEEKMGRTIDTQVASSILPHKTQV
jgi:hypothetical protein